MSCPDCDSKLEKRKQKPVMKEITKFSGKIKVIPIKWFCPSCKDIKKNSKEELVVMGKLRNYKYLK